MLMDPAVHQHIARPRIEATNRTICFEDADIADATDIGHHPGFGVAAKDSLMKGRYQRGALATGGHVSAAKIGNHINAGQFSQQGGIIYLARVAAGRKVTNGLAVRSNGAHIGSGNAACLQQLPHAICIHQQQLLGCQ